MGEAGEEGAVLISNRRKSLRAEIYWVEEPSSVVFTVT